jgi:hypothetical protein
MSWGKKQENKDRGWKGNHRGTEGKKRARRKKYGIRELGN